MSQASRELVHITSVSRSYTTCGSRIRHRDTTKKRWYAYGFNDLGKFIRVKIHPLQVPIYKIRIRKIITVHCDSCGLRYKTVKSKSYVCPNCGNLCLLRKRQP